MATVARLPLPVTRACLGVSVEVNVSCGRLWGLSKKTSHFWSGDFSSLARRSPTVRKQHWIDGGQNWLGGGSGLFDGQGLDQGLRAGEIERDFGRFAVARGPGEAQIAVPAFDADFAINVVGRQVDRRGGGGGWGSAEEGSEDGYAYADIFSGGHFCT